MFFIIGTKFLAWGSGLTVQPLHCSECNVVAPFTIKKGMRFLTLFFIIPTIPLSGVRNMVECPSCGARFLQG